MDVLQVSIWKAVEDDRSMLVSAVGFGISNVAGYKT